MKRFDFKPLLLLIPFVLILVVFYIIDEPVPVTPGSGSLTLDSTQQVAADTGASSGDSTASTEAANTADTQNIYEVINPINRLTPREVPDDADKYLLVISTVGSVQTGGGEYIYEEPDEESTQLAILPYHCAVIAYEEQDDDYWVHVKLMGDDSDGYIKRDSVYAMELAVGDMDPVRNSIVKDALSYLGLKFVRYGKSLEDGIDCSNFIQQIYEKNGIDIPNTPTGQGEYGITVSDEEAQPGDIVFYERANDGNGHVALYLGDGIVIHSSGHEGKKYPSGGVHMSCLYYHDRDYYKMVNVLDVSDEDNDNSSSDNDSESADTSDDGENGGDNE